MTQNSDVIEHMVGLIEPALTGIEEGRGEAEMQGLQAALRDLLSEFIRLVERHPGLEAATADRYAAAVALIHDTGSGSRPTARKLRLFRDARRRFKERLSAARPSRRAARGGWRQEELLVPA